MILGSKDVQAVRSLQDDAISLKAQLSVLGTQVAAICAQEETNQLLARVEERLATLESKADDLETSMVKALQEQEILQSRLEDIVARSDETMKQLRGDVARVELQTAHDIEQLRQTNAAIAASALFPGSMR